MSFLPIFLTTGLVILLLMTLLWLVSLALFYSILKVEPRQPLWAQRIALVGSIAFCIQTVLLDAVVWVILFHL